MKIIAVVADAVQDNARIDSTFRGVIPRAERLTDQAWGWLKWTGTNWTIKYMASHEALMEEAPADKLHGILRRVVEIGGDMSLLMTAQALPAFNAAAHQAGIEVATYHHKDTLFTSRNKFSS